MSTKGKDPDHESQGGKGTRVMRCKYTKGERQIVDQEKMVRPKEKRKRKQKKKFRIPPIETKNNTNRESAQRLPTSK